MKRHPALYGLSTDHHHGLVHARHLIKAGEEPIPPHDARLQTAQEFLDFWEKDTNRHFREEEEVLLPTFARYGDLQSTPVVRMLVEHVQIRRLVDDLQSQVRENQPDPDTMRELGTLLRAHIRYEEDVVFPLIESTMPEEALDRLPARLAAFAAAD